MTPAVTDVTNVTAGSDVTNVMADADGTSLTWPRCGVCLRPAPAQMRFSCVVLRRDVSTYRHGRVVTERNATYGKRIREWDGGNCAQDGDRVSDFLTSPSCL